MNKNTHAGKRSLSQNPDACCHRRLRYIMSSTNWSQLILGGKKKKPASKE